MIRVLQETRTVFRSEAGRRGRLTRRAAYRDAAWEAWRAKYPCDCEPETGYRCWQHGFPHSITEQEWISMGEMGSCEPPQAEVEFREKREKTIARLTRWLMWRDSK